MESLAAVKDASFLNQDVRIITSDNSGHHFRGDVLAICFYYKHLDETPVFRTSDLVYDDTSVITDIHN